ncbi:apolipoprotein N-acyltransferase [Ruegeria sp. 2012CJ41-6]|uniref:Apolipoprotein N-acyltransferase n=1 Tax=Ruegeria spongiae TaxID=2942209 RepID=A0ABT0Q1V5_9RHOB|nr:apolipoprotein N-acyltransferase [Ruegeria spongiae]MCL6283806.1 apolipoprotein N-acyltransferase [Ruegeria spongiae]
MSQRLRWSLRPRLALAVVLGVIAALGLAPYDLWPATLGALICLPVLALQDCTRKRAAMIGWAFGLGYFGHGLAWIVEPFLVDIPRHGWMAPFALVLMAGGLALFWAAAFWVAAASRLGLVGRSWLLVFSWSLAEFARAYVLTGFPWAALAQIWVETPLAQSLAFVGPQGLAIATLAAALPMGAALIGTGHVLPRVLNAVPALGLLAVAVYFSALAAPAVMTGKTVRLVQPNAPQHQKWDPEHIPRFFRRQIEFTATAPSPDLIVWPETAVPTWLDEAEGVFQTISDAATGVPVVLGIRRYDSGRIYNSAVYLDGNGKLGGVYDKHHLVPFGEYVPLGDLLARFGIHGFAANAGQGFSAGPGPELLSLGPVGSALPLICYEAVFPQDVGNAPARPDMLLQLTNDAWFGSWSGPYQHLAQARMRAIEQGLPMVRVANTGISAMIDPHGGTIAQIPLGFDGYIDAPLPAPLAPTHYAYTGDLPAFVLVLVGLGGMIGLHRRRAG